LYKSKEYLHNQYYCHTDWQGGIYASPTLEGNFEKFAKIVKNLGSRAGVNIALCWATLLYHGKSGYEKNARAVVDTTRKIRDGYVSKFSKISKVSKITKKNLKIHIFFFKKLFFLELKIFRSSNFKVLVTFV
jgi:hypothetical protein